ncbi:hypothetical protein DUNSADRAFT_2882 [Dunaliella salina]|uniref:Encoded protein n=1 Tax=Dunaliella salina TaxID=3046 RepID=A0ABQ7GV21_DUNSA|nr:hypothetical protein DUNSADRAFT_2882 [Dunaliella salina]|eukprot:KAF5838414.1 hypothetical protein DUNSADRAFT_2882 [Dunaliella salina]
MNDALKCILHAHLPNLRELKLERGPARDLEDIRYHYVSFLDFVAISGQPLELLDARNVDHMLIKAISGIRTLRSLRLTAARFDDLTLLSDLPDLRDFTLSHLKQCPRVWPATLCNFSCTGRMHHSTLGEIAVAAAAGYLPSMRFLSVKTLGLEESEAGRAHDEGTCLAAHLASVPNLSVQIRQVD